MAQEGIERLVNRQVLAWEEERRARERGDQREPMPCITISREFGTQGAKIAEVVGQRLGFTVYDKELLSQIAHSEKVRLAVLNSVDERVRDRISEWIADQFGQAGMTTSKFIAMLTRLIMTIGYHGKAVIVGRGAHFVLDPSRTLRVRAYAPLEVRARNVMEERGLSKNEALALIRDTDLERAEFHRKYFHKDWASPEHYDLLINTATYPPEKAAGLVVEAYYLKFGRPE